MSESTKPKRAVERPTAVAAGDAPRLHWRVVVQSAVSDGGKQAPGRMVWHLAACTAPLDPDAHCDEGKRLLAEGADADGHCLVGVGPSCIRCEALALQQAAAEAAVQEAAAAAAAAAANAPAPAAV